MQNIYNFIKNNKIFVFALILIVSLVGLGLFQLVPEVISFINDINKEYYLINEIYPWLYSIYDPRNVYCYLVIGEKCALLFDTGYGLGSLPKVIKKITDKPVVVVLGHGHFDHIGGAGQFKEVWLHENDFNIFQINTTNEIRHNYAHTLIVNNANLPRRFSLGKYAVSGKSSLRKLESDKIFDLGGLSVKIIEMEGHTAGSIGALIQEHRVLLTSDSVNPHIWLFLDESLPVSQYITMLERNIQLDFDTFFIGHSDTPLPKSDFQYFINTAQNATAENSELYMKRHSQNIYRYQEDGAYVYFIERSYL